MATFSQHLAGRHIERARPMRPWPKLAPLDRAPEPKPLVMGTDQVSTRPALARVRTRWQPDSMPTFPIEPADDPVRRLADTERSALTLLTLVLCVTASLALLGFGLQIVQ